MSVLEKLREQAQTVLEPEETLQAVFGAQTAQPHPLPPLLDTWAIRTIATSLLRRYRVIVISDRRTLVCRTKPLSPTTIDEVLRELPRSVPLAQPDGRWWQCQSLGERMWIHRRYFDEVRAAERNRSAPPR